MKAQHTNNLKEVVSRKFTAINVPIETRIIISN